MGMGKVMEMKKMRNRATTSKGLENPPMDLFWCI